MTLAAIASLLQSALMLVAMLQGSSALSQDIRDQAAQVLQEVVVQAVSSSAVLSSSFKALPIPLSESTPTDTPVSGAEGYACPSGYGLYNDGHFGYKCQKLGLAEGSVDRSVAATTCTLGSTDCIDVNDTNNLYIAPPVAGPVLTEPYTIDNWQTHVTPAPVDLPQSQETQ